MPKPSSPHACQSTAWTSTSASISSSPIAARGSSSSRSGSSRRDHVALARAPSRRTARRSPTRRRRWRAPAGTRTSASARARAAGSASRSTSCAEGGSGGRGGRRSTQLVAAAADQVGHVGVALADRLGLDRRRCRARARRGTPRAAAARAAAGARVPPPPRGCRRSPSLRCSVNRNRCDSQAGLYDSSRHPPQLRRRSLMMRRLSLLTRPARAARAARHRRRVARARSIDLRGAARAARRLDARRDARRDHGASASPTSASSSTGATSRPRRTRKTQARGFDAADPAAYPADTWDRLDGLVAAARRAASRSAHAHRPGAEVGDQEQARTTSPSRPEGVPGRSRPRSAAATATASSMWSIWNEPNQPQFLHAAVRARASRTRRALPQALPGGLRAACARRRPTAATRS